MRAKIQYIPEPGDEADTCVLVIGADGQERLLNSIHPTENTFSVPKGSHVEISRYVHTPGTPLDPVDFNPGS